MNELSANAIFRDNTHRNRFELQIGEETAFANYHVREKTLFIDYVEAPPALRGTGAASKLMTYIHALATRDNMTIMPICGYAAAWLKKRDQS